MIKIKNNVIRQQKNFWNGCVFHPTDAVEDAWGRRIIDRIAQDGAINTIRIYTMFEDIVYMDENGCLKYDFRLNDLRLDYLVEKGFDILLGYAGIPDCIAASTDLKSSVSKNKTRYKGKMWNCSPPKDVALWEEICYEYTKHIVERYGIERVSKWHCQCFNEPDLPQFFLPHIPKEQIQKRLPDYCQMYAAFERGARRVSEDILIGGPALANVPQFLTGWLDFVKQNNLKLDFISLHNYGTEPHLLNDGSRPISVENILDNHKEYLDVIINHGFGNTNIIVDEWGASSAGFFNREDAPDLMFRETEVFSAFFAKLICKFINSDCNISKLMICLSGQHEMTEDFSGFRNFFTLNFITKPIYNAYILASKLKDNLLEAEVDNQNIYLVPTKSEQDDYAVLLTYSSDNFKEDLPTVQETVTFEQDIKGKRITVWCIDKNNTNPYRLYERLGIKQPTAQQVCMLREEGRLKPMHLEKGTDKITLKLSPNATYLITVNE